MIYSDRDQAQLECDLNERRGLGKWVPQLKWSEHMGRDMWTPTPVPRTDHDDKAMQARRTQYHA